MLKEWIQRGKKVLSYEKEERVEMEREMKGSDG